MSADFMERPKRLGLCVMAVSGSRASNVIGDGQRILYLDDCDGSTLAALDCQGQPFSISIRDVHLLRVYGIDGKERRHSIDPDTGHLTLFLQQEGDDEVWEDICAWARYEPSARLPGTKKKKHERKLDKPGWLE